MADFINALARSIALTVIALCILAKATELNDIGHTFWQDPLELWTGLGIALLLLDRALDTLRRRDDG